jgi:hypothetical protein
VSRLNQRELLFGEARDFPPKFYCCSLQGSTETFKDVMANRWIVVREGKGIVERPHFHLPKARPLNDSFLQVGQQLRSKNNKLLTISDG